jgi:hypothetical protein
MEGHLAEACNYTLQPELKDELATAILHLEVRRHSLLLAEEKCSSAARTLGTQ